jgi:hypothetical protein
MSEAGSLVASRYWLQRRIAAGRIAEERRACDLGT